MLHLFGIDQLPKSIPRDVRRSIEREWWRFHCRSPLFWAVLAGQIVVSVPIGLVFLRLTAGRPIAEIFPFVAILPPFILGNVLLNRLFDKRRSAIWLAHHVCPTCGYNLTANTSGICPECGTTFAVKA